MKAKPYTFPLIWESSHEAVFFKPSGVASQLSSDYKKGSFLEMVRQQRGQPQWELPHRLDRITSGLILICKTRESLVWQNKQIQDRCWDKFYLARVKPPYAFNNDNIIGSHKAYLKRNGQKSEVVRSGGKPSFLNILSISEAPEFPGEYHVLIKLLTGRYHQIRVMLAHLGLPLTDDFLYNPGINRDKSSFYLESLLLKFSSYADKEPKLAYFEDNPYRENLSEKMTASILETADKLGI